MDQLCACVESVLSSFAITPSFSVPLIGSQLFLQQEFLEFCTHAAYVTDPLLTEYTNRVLAEVLRASNKDELMSYMCGIGNKTASRWSPTSSAVQMLVSQSTGF